MVEDQGKNQIKAIKDNKKQLDNKQPGNNELLLSKEREIFKNMYKKRFNRIGELSFKNWLSWLEIYCY